MKTVSLSSSLSYGIQQRLSILAVHLTILVVSFQLAAAQSGSYKDLHDFGGTVLNTNGQPVQDGLNPPSGVVFDDQGNMYGTTMAGGQNGRGNVWEITVAGFYKDLHDFGGKIITSINTYGLDGTTPYSGVTVDKEGNLFGTTGNGGAYGAFPGDGMVWEITAGGVYKDLHDFGGTVTNSGGIEGPDGVSPIAGVTLDSAGNIFGTTLAGGPNNVNQAGGGIVWEITVAGGYKDVHDFGGTVINASGKKGPDGVEPAGLAFDKVGNLYGTTDFGGPNGAVRGSGIAWEITVAGKYKDLHDFGGTVTIASGKRGQDGGTPFGGVALDASGNLYGTADFGGANAGGMVWEITTVGVYKDLHDFGGKVTNADGKGGLDGLQPWSGVKFDAAGNMYGTTDNGGPNTIGNITAGIVWEITAAHVYKDLHDFGANVTNSDGSTGPDGNFPYYAGVTFDRSGNMFGTTQYGGAYGGGAGLVWEISAPPSLTVATVTLDPTTVVGGSKATGTVTLTGQAPVGGTLVKLSSNSTTAEVPASVKVESGKTTATFTVNTITVASNVTATVKATVGAAYQTANLTIEAPKLKALVLSPTSVIGGKSVLARLTLTSAAPVGGLTITVSASSSGVTAPETVRIPVGATSATFTVKTKAVTTTTAKTLSASLNGASVTAGLTVKP